MKLKLFVTSVAAFIFLLAVAGCGGAAANGIPGAIPTDVTGAVPTESLPTDAATGDVSTGGTTSLPADWPADLPIYPGTTVIATMNLDFDGALTIGATLDSTDDPKTVNDWYVTAVQNAGWQISGQGESEGNYVISGVKGSDQLTVAIATGLDTPNTSVNVSKIILEP